MSNDSFSGKIFSLVIGLSGFQAYAAIIVVLLACGLGVPIPEDITLFAAGFLAFKNRISLAGAIIVGLVGVLLGDTFLYFIGRTFGRRVFTWPFFRRLFTPGRIKKAEEKIQSNSKLICFTSRFAPGFRAPIYLTSGILRVPFTVFIFMDGLAALISVPVWVFLAYFLGDELEMLFAIASRANIAIGLGLLLLIVGYVVIQVKKHW